MPRRNRSARPLLLALPFLVLLGGSRALRAQPPAGSPLVIATTTDLRGETSPCGCHTPRGGFSRIASYVDSLRRAGGRSLYLDVGGALPDLPTRQDLADFMFH